MNGWMLVAALVLAPAPALAQTYTPPQPLGPFSFGMSADSARAAAPGVEWDVLIDENLHRASMRTRTEAVELYGVHFRVQLAFAADAMTLIHLTAELPLPPQGCRDRHRAMVEAAMLTRAPFTQRDNWFFFYHDPYGPRGHGEGDTFVPSPNTPVRGVVQTVRNQRVQFDSVILVYDGTAHGQMYYSAAGADGRMTAHSITWDGESVCRLAISAANRRASGGFRPSAGPSGAERLAERLAVAELARPPVYLYMPEPHEIWRHYPSRALDSEISGAAQLNCLVLADGVLDCAVHSETPPEWSFGEAALSTASGFRIDTFAIAPGHRVLITIRFMLPN